MYITVLVLGALNSFTLFGGPVTDVYNATNPDTFTLNGTTYSVTNPTGIVSDWTLVGVSVASYAAIAIFGAVGLLMIVAGFYIGILGISLSLGVYLYQLFNWLPASFLVVITGVICVVYLIGIMQFVTGRSERLSR